MLSLEKQVCSLELAKKLKELNIKQESLSYWKFSNGMLEKVSNIEIGTELVYGKQPIKSKTLGTWDTVSAYTVAELGEILKPWFDSQDSLSDHKDAPLPKTPSEIFNADYWTNVLIYVLEQKLITL